MNEKRHPKVQASHLAREAYLYARQAVPNVDCLPPQYALRQQAVALGWPAEHVVVIDSDIGCSGASAAGRRGFQKLVRRVRRGRVGLVMALAPPRWTRNVTAWHRLPEACALNGTLVLDQHGIYDPADAQDRVLLGCSEMLPRSMERALQKKEALV